MRQMAGSFLLRWWRSPDDQRFEVEHIQTGERVVVASLTAAMIWLRARMAAETAGPPAPSEPDGDEAVGQEKRA